MIRQAFIMVFLLKGVVFGQPKIFAEDELVAVIKNFHPVARQAELDVKIAGADVIRSRAGFDPVLTGDNAGKEVGGLTYYNNRQVQLKLPVWYGIDLVAGHEKVTGERNNPDQTPGVMEYLGFSVPLLQNLAMDKRRADLKQARIFRELSEIEQKVVINNLVRDALDAYWSWWKAYEQAQLTKLALKNAEQRFAMIRSGVVVGERAAIDTVEAATQLQTLSIRLLEVESTLIQERINLSSFLWSADGRQYELPPNVVPQQWTEANLIS